jgi:N-methylhydantoinase B
VRPIRVIAPEGTVYNARRPAATMSRAVIGHTVSDLIFTALRDALPDRVRGNGGSTPTWVLVLVGDDYAGKNYQRVIPLNGGLGGQEGADGEVLSFPSNTQNLGVEALEQLTPVLVRAREIVPDSGGAGRFRGGNGVRFAVEARSRTTYSLAINRVAHAPRGILGGGDGRAGAASINGTPLAPGAEGTLRPGDVLTLETPGGGGFGVPLERDRARVAKDVAEEMVSTGRAEKLYGHRAA